MNFRSLVPVILIPLLLFSVQGSSALPSHSMPDWEAVPESSSSTANGTVSEVWNVLWGPVVSIVTYFEELIDWFLNLTMYEMSSVLASWSSSIGGYGIWGPTVFAIAMGLTFIGVYSSLAAGDDAKGLMGY